MGKRETGHFGLVLHLNIERDELSHQEYKKEMILSRGNHTVKLAVLLTILCFNIILNAIVIFLRSLYYPIHISGYVNTKHITKPNKSV